MKLAKKWIEDIPIDPIPAPLPPPEAAVVPVRAPVWRAVWRVLLVRPRLVRELGSGLPALEEHEWRREHDRHWNMG
jgi:hypothetical protein